MSNTIKRSPEYGALQPVVDRLFENDKTVSQMQLILAVESAGLCEDLQEVCGLVPSGTYARRKLCDQINAAITGHGWGRVYGTVE